MRNVLRVLFTRLLVASLLFMPVAPGSLPGIGVRSAQATETLKALGQRSSVLARSGTITVTIATPAVVTWTGSTLAVDDQVSFTTSGALPTGITSGTIYWVISAGLATNSFEISTSKGGSAVNTSGSQSGTHTGTAWRVLYAVPGSTSTVVSTIVVANRNNSSGTFHITIQPASAAIDVKHYIAFGTTVPANDSVVIRLGLTLATTDIITVGGSDGNISFGAWGSEVQ